MTAKPLRCVGRRAYTSNEMDVVPIDAGARPSRGGAATRPIAGPRQAQRPAGLRSGELTQHSAAGNMSPSVDDILNCLQKYDEAHQDF